MRSSFENPWIRKNRVLTQILICSVAVNIGLALTLFVGRGIFQKEARVKVVGNLELPQVVADGVQRFFVKNFDELVSDLKDDTLIYDGYKIRDFALSCLVHFHYFDLEKAIGKACQEIRKMSFMNQVGGEVFTIDLFPELEAFHFDLIEQFIKSTSWPLTNAGLYVELKSRKDVPQSLKETMFALKPFQKITHAFYRYSGDVTPGGITHDDILALLLDGDIDLFTKVCETIECTPESIREMLLSYLHVGSKKAVELLLIYDADHVLHKLDDVDLKQMVALVQERSFVNFLFLKKLLCTFRSDALKKMAGMKLYELEGESIPEVYDHEVALKRFIPFLFNASKEEVLPPKKKEPTIFKAEQKVHIVQEGESLWRLSKQYDVDLEELKTVNGIADNSLWVGQRLRIP